MENLGQQLKQLRTQLSLTLEQVTEETRVKSNIITSIENDNTDAISSIYLNAYKKTLLDFYNKALSNSDYLANIKNVSNTIICQCVSKNQISKLQNNKKNDKLSHQIEKKSNINQISNFVNYNNYATEVESNFTSVPINTKDIKEKLNIVKADGTENKIKNIIPANVVEIKEETNKNISRKNIKQNNLNKKIFKKSLNMTIKDLLIYISGGIIISVIVFFVFIYDTGAESRVIQQIKYDNFTTDSTIRVIPKNSDIYSYFENDSIILVAHCKDSAWIKIEIDNKKTDDLLMKPGMENRWSALEKITLATSNVGGINFYKNDTLLPILGPKGTMVQNIVLTKDGVKNINPLSVGNNVVSISELNPNQNIVIPSIIDTTKIQKTKQYTNKKKKEEPPKPIIIDFSKPVNTKPPILENENKGN